MFKKRRVMPATITVQMKLTTKGVISLWFIWGGSISQAAIHRLPITPYNTAPKIHAAAVAAKILIKPI
jgi:hypothetical protein